MFGDLVMSSRWVFGILINSSILMGALPGRLPGLQYLLMTMLAGGQPSASGAAQCHRKTGMMIDTLWWTYKKQWKMAIEIVDFPINSVVIFHCELLVHQRVQRHETGDFSSWLTIYKDWWVGVLWVYRFRGLPNGFAPVFRGLCGSRFGDQSSDPLDPKMPWTGVSFLGPEFQRKDICTICERLGFCKCESVLLQ